MKGILLTLALLTSATQAQVRTEGSEARLALTNVLIQEVKNGRQASFALRWDYLPESQGFKERFLNVFNFDGGKIKIAQEYTLPNEVLRDPAGAEKWFKTLKNRGLLVRALSRGKLFDANTLKEALDAGEAGWSQSFFQALGFQNGLGSATVPWLDYVTAKRDFFAMEYLLTESRGAGAVVEFTPQPRGENPLLLSKDLKWRIKVYPLETTSQTPLYRFSVSVETQTIKKLFRGSEGQPAEAKPRLDVTVGLLKEFSITGQKDDPHKFYKLAKVSLAKDSTVIETKPLAGSDELKEVESTLSPSTGATFIDVFAGSTAKGLLAPLIANNSEAQLFTGGLIGNGAPKTVFGLNYIFTEQPDGNLGFLYGFIPDANSSLFLGPSLSFGPFIAAVGLRFYNRDDDSVTSALAASLSLDLSRVFGKRAEPIHLNPQLVKPGSEIWADSDKLYEGKQLVLCRVQQAPPAPGATQDPDDIATVTIVQVKDATGKPPETPFGTVVPAGAYSRLVLPKGQYTVTPSPGYEILEQEMLTEAPIPNPTGAYEPRATLSTKGDRPRAVVYVLRKAAGTMLPR